MFGPELSFTPRRNAGDFTRLAQRLREDGLVVYAEPSSPAAPFPARFTP